MIIDSLTHITPDGRWFSTTYNASETRLLREMDKAGIDKAVVVALADFIENDFVVKVCARHPDRLIPGASINPVTYATSKQATDELRALLAGEYFAVLKLHPRLNKYDPLDPKCLAVLEAVATSDTPLPIWLDTLLYFQGGLLRKPPVDTIHELVGRFSPLNFVLLHACGANIAQLAEAIRDCPNAFLDISYTVHRHKGSSIELDLRHLLQVFDQRMIFGSDFPEISIPEAIESFDSLNLDLPIGKRYRILGDNLRAILDL